MTEEQRITEEREAAAEAEWSKELEKNRDKDEKLFRLTWKDVAINLLIMPVIAPIGISLFMSWLMMMDVGAGFFGGFPILIYSCNVALNHLKFIKGKKRGIR